MSHELKQSCVQLRDFISEPSDNASVNYVVYKGDYYVSNENIFMYKVDPETLETKEKVWAGGIRGFAHGTGESLLAVSKSSKGEPRFQRK